MAERFGSLLPRAAGVAVGASGVGLMAAGLWARREAGRALARERIVFPLAADAAPATVATAAAARTLAETIRERTVEATGGRTYAETEEYLAPGGTTSEEASATRDETSGEPVRNPDVDLWLRSTTLQTALVQAYMAFRVADLMLALGAAFTAAGVGIGATASRN